MNSKVGLDRLFFESDEQASYPDLKFESAKIDEALGFEIARVEAEITRIHSGELAQEKSRTWVGLDPATLQTPYHDLKLMLEKLSLMAGECVVDLGAGYGRMGIVMAKHFPENAFLGIEKEVLRVQEGNRIYTSLGLKNADLRAEDLLSHEFILPESSHFFLYDFSSNVSDVEWILEKLKARAKEHAIQVIGRGRLARDQIERHHPWLSQVIEPRHFGRYSLYQSGVR